MYKNSVDYENVKKTGKTVKYGSFAHWILYLTAKVNISSQKGGKPNYAVCYLLEVYGIFAQQPCVFTTWGNSYKY